MKSGGDIHLVGVANIAKWHGYDRVIEGIKKYYLNGGKRKVFFHIIGTGLELERLKKLASSSLVKDYIVFHGTVVGDELDDLFNQYDLGVSVLATYRSGMKNICDSLKSKEYCARGIPFITGELEHFYDGKEFVLTIPDNDTPVNIYNVCDFADRIADNPQIKEAMLEFAKSYCGWDYSFRSVIDYLKGQE